MESAPPWHWPRAAYLHIPFCAHHCGYCDFAIAVGQHDLRDAYLDALAQELATLRQPQPMHSRFLGGGTPSELTAAQLDRLGALLDHWLPLTSGAEFSIEANPDSLDAEKIRVLAAHGLTRVSLGAQSFHPAILRQLDRRHEPAVIPRVVELLRSAGLTVALDLIFGVPGQTLADWQADLEQALALEPEHLSTYGLTFEKGTPLWKRWQRSEVQPMDEETELAMYAAGIDRLEAAGFEHYEVSNFARPGQRCRHNLVYWANEAYFGFGMGAARYVAGCREINVRHLQTYLQRVQGGRSPTQQSETLPPRERALETAAIQLRRAEGIVRACFAEQTGSDLDALVGDVLVRHCELGLLADDGAGVRLTRAGKYVADAVVAALFRA